MKDTFTIRYFNEDISFLMKQKRTITGWLRETLAREGKSAGEVNYIFCSDRYLLGLNKSYLDHNTYTDIITFDHLPGEKQVSSDIYISVERVKENAQNFKVSFADELHRVMVHGILHLCGYRDKKKAEKEEMRKRENYWLARLTAIQRSK